MVFLWFGVIRLALRVIRLALRVIRLGDSFSFSLFEGERNALARLRLGVRACAWARVCLRVCVCAYVREGVW